MSFAGTLVLKDDFESKENVASMLIIQTLTRGWGFVEAFISIPREKTRTAKDLWSRGRQLTGFERRVETVHSCLVVKRTASSKIILSSWKIHFTVCCL